MELLIFLIGRREQMVSREEIVKKKEPPKKDDAGHVHAPGEHDDNRNDRGEDRPVDEELGNPGHGRSS